MVLLSQSVLSLGPQTGFFFVPGPGRAVLPLRQYSDFYLMKIVNHVASHVSAQYLEFLMTWGQIYTSFRFVHRVHFMLPSLVAPPDWPTLITLLISFFLPIFIFHLL